ncbi:MAG TPA: hypothetical protein VJN44_14285, partial [Roseateles sp.]|nr:hypothetical protein [Roseateles sp.]
MKFGILLLGLALLPQARAADDGRHDIAQQRSRIEARYKEALQACTDRFAVNRCRQDATDERLDALKPLRERELRLDAEERSARAARQRERMEAKQQESTRREGEGQARAVLSAAPTAPPASGPKPAHVPDSAGHARSVQAELKKNE